MEKDLFKEKSMSSKKIFIALFVAFVAIFSVACSAIRTYTVSFDTDGAQVIEAQRVENWNKASKPDDPSKEGYEFAGWYLGEEKYLFDQVVSEDINLVAKWERIYYTVTVDYNGGGENYSCKVEYGEKMQELGTPVKDRYEFLGWYVGESEYDFNSAVMQDIQIVAKWQAKVYHQVTITNEFAESASTVVEVEEGHCVEQPQAPEKEGYLFLGWYVGENEYDFASVINSDVEIIAKWEEEITFDKVMGAWQGDEVMQGSVIATYDITVMLNGSGFASYTMYGYEMSLDVSGFEIVNNRLVMTYVNYGSNATCEFALKNGKLCSVGITSGEYGSLELAPKAINVEEIAKTWEGSEDYYGMALAYEVTINADGSASGSVDMFGEAYALELKEISNKIVLSYMGAMDCILFCHGENLEGVGIFGGNVVLTEKIVVENELSFDLLAGTWKGSEEFYGMVFEYTFVIDTNGNGSAEYQSMGYVTVMEGANYAISEGKLLVEYNPYPDTVETLTFEYENGILKGNSPMGTIISLSKTLTINEIAGEWQGVEETAYGNYNYNFVINADGTGSGTYVDEAGAYPSTMDIIATEISGNTVTVKYISYTMEYEIVFTYEAGTMTSDLGAMWGALTVEKQ